MDLEEKRDAVLVLHLKGKSNQQIVSELCMYNVNKSFVSRTVKRYKETGSVRKRYGGGRRPTVITPQNLRKVEKLLERNPGCSGRQLASEMGISRKSMHRMLRDKLMVEPFRIQKKREFTTEQKTVRSKNTKELNETDSDSDLKDVIFVKEYIDTSADDSASPVQT